VSPRVWIVPADRDFVCRLAEPVRSGEDELYEVAGTRLLGEGGVGRWALGELFEDSILFSSALGGVVLVGVEVRGGEEGGVTRGEARGVERGCAGGLEEVGIDTVRGAAMGWSVLVVFFLFFFDASAERAVPLFFRLLTIN
jgi:hypothetical protein